MRRWRAGDSFELDGIEFRVVQGVKSPDDLRLEHLIRDVDGIPHWIATSMAVGFALADFFYENEDVLYPPGRGFKGGNKYLTDARHAARFGWKNALAGLRAEKAMKHDNRLFQMEESTS